MGILVWGFDKGFTLADGGHCVLRYQDIQPNETHTWILEHLLVKALVPDYLRTILGLRYLAFFLNILSSIIFGLAVNHVYLKIHHQKINTAWLILAMLAGFMVSYPGLPCELSYNNLSQFIVISSTALIMLSLFSLGTKSIIWAGLAGLLGSSLFIVKIPAGITFFLLVSLILLLAGKRAGLLIFAAAILCFAVILWSLFDIDHHWFVDNLLQMFNNTDKNHFGIRITAPLKLLWKLAWVFLVAAAASAAWWVYKNKREALLCKLRLCACSL